MGNMSLENILPVIREQLELLDEARCFSIMVTNLETVVYIDDNSWLCDYVTIGEALTSIPKLEKVILNRKRLDEKVNFLEAHLTCRIYATPVIENDTVLGVIAFLEKLPDDVTKAPYLTVRTDDRWIPIHLNDIIYLEAKERRTHVISKDMTGIHRLNLKELEKRLRADVFVRCHRSYIINLNQVKEIHPDSHSTFILVMNNQSRIPVSQNFSKYIRSRFDF